MKKVILISLMALSVFAKEESITHKHTHTHTQCDKPIILDETELDKIFELKGKIYKVLKGDEVNPSLLYVMDPRTNKFKLIKQ